MLQTPATLQMIQDIRQGLIPVGKAVEADNATNAANDGNGSNISNNYAKKAPTIIPVTVVNQSGNIEIKALGSWTAVPSSSLAVVIQSNVDSYDIGGIYTITGGIVMTGVLVLGSKVGDFFSAGVKGQYQQLSDGTYNLIINIEQ